MNTVHVVYRKINLFVMMLIKELNFNHFALLQKMLPIH